MSMLERGFVAWLGTLGLSARAIVYFLVSGLMLRAAINPGEDEAGVGPTEAFLEIEAEPLGQAILILIGVGLFLYSIWRFHQGILDRRNEGEDASGWAARLGMIMSGSTYALIGAAAIGVTLGANDGSGPGLTEAMARWLLGQPLGRFAVIVVGLSLVVIGGIQVWRGWTERWTKHVDLSGWRHRTKLLIIFGIVGRGILIALIGVFFLFAGWQADPDEARGLAATLGWLRDQPFGFWLYGIGALIIGAYGVYSALQARSCFGTSRV
ncbi:DUF1206 domain-containing protein [Maricaulis sp. CAU 1757]